MLAAVLALVALRLPAALAPVARDAPSDTESTIDTNREIEELRSGLMEDNYDYQQMYPRHGEEGRGEGSHSDDSQREDPQASSPLPDRFAIVRNADGSRHPEQDVNFNFTRHSNKNISRYSKDFGYREVRRQIEEQRVVEIIEGERELQNKTRNMKSVTKKNTSLNPEMRRNNANNQKTVKKENASVYLEVRKQKIKDQTTVPGSMEGKRQLRNKTDTENKKNVKEDTAKQ